jgi:hypothetical protein
MLLRTTTIETLLLAALLVLVAPFSTPAVAQTETYGDDYSDGRYGRVRYEENGITIRRASAGLQDAGGTNSPVYPGDRILTSSRQRAEVQLSSGTLVRVDELSEVTFLALPDPYAAYPDNTVLQISVGTVQVTSTLSSQEEFRIDTPAGSVYLLGDGDTRIEVAADGRTRVSSRRGVAEVSSAGGSVLVRGGTLTDVYAGSVPSDPTPFNTFVADAFDRWVAGRELTYDNAYVAGQEVASQAYGELPDEVQPYSDELAAYGDWRYADDYGYVWVPSGMAPSWRPYSQGYWDYGPNGYFWVSYEPWGWAPYRYGRWAFIGGIGWGWAPGSVFAGGWGGWSWGSAYVGWSALGYYGGPAYYGGGIYYGYYSPYCWSFVPYHGFHHRHYSYHGVDEVGRDLVNSAIVTRPPDVSPQRLASSSEMRKVAYRQATQEAVPRVLPSQAGGVADAGFRSLEARESSIERSTSERQLSDAKPTAPRRTTSSTRSTPRVHPSGAGGAQFDRGPTVGGSTQPLSSAPRRMTNSSRAPEARSLQMSVPTPSRRTESHTVLPRQSTPDRRDIYRRLSTPRAPQKRSSPGSVRKTPTSSSGSGKTPPGHRAPARVDPAPPGHRAPARVDPAPPGHRAPARVDPAPPGHRARGLREGPGRVARGPGAPAGRAADGSNDRSRLRFEGKVRAAVNPLDRGPWRAGGSSAGSFFFNVSSRLSRTALCEALRSATDSVPERPQQANRIGPLAPVELRRIDAGACGKLGPRFGMELERVDRQLLVLEAVDGDLAPPRDHPVTLGRLLDLLPMTDDNA